MQLYLLMCTLHKGGEPMPMLFRGPDWASKGRAEVLRFAQQVSAPCWAATLWWYIPISIGLRGDLCDQKKGLLARLRRGGEQVKLKGL